MNGEEIVVAEGLIIAATVILGFIINQLAAWLGLKLSEDVKKTVVFVVATGLSAYAVLEAGVVKLPDPSENLVTFTLVLLAYATLNFKVAQPVYDKIWKGLLKAKA